ncbi:MAG TPA: hypothetical protein VKC17_02080, partial [Sphingomicrobium sp.]|nr:hypothetical protein [Sphingomicrobium sp.]
LAAAAAASPAAAKEPFPQTASFFDFLHRSSPPIESPVRLTGRTLTLTNMVSKQLTIHPEDVSR